MALGGAEPGGCKPPAGVGGPLALAHTLPPLAAPTHTIYVDVAKGSDAGAGTLGSPFRTLGVAQAAGRGHARAAGANYTVLLRAGTYHLAAPLKLGPLV
jgi:hypothetical protein